MTGAARLTGAAGALALLTGLAALVWFAIVAPLQDWRAEVYRSRDAAIDELARLQSSIANLSVEQAQLADNTELDVLWRAEQMGQATARIQSELSRIASESGVSLRSISPLRTRDMTLAQSAGFRLELEAALDQLSVFLAEIEHHSPSLLVEKASLRRLNKPNNTALQPLIFAQIDISAPIVVTAEDSQ